MTAMRDFAYQYMYFLKRVVNKYPIHLFVSILLFQAVLLLVSRDFLKAIADNPLGLSAIVLFSVLIYGFWLFLIFATVVIYVLPIGLPSWSAKRWEGLANKHGYWIKRKSSFRNLFELSHSNKYVRIVENAWFAKIFQRDETTSFYVAYYYSMIVFPVIALFSQSTTAEIETGTKLPHVIFDNPASSIGGVKIFDLLLLQEDEIRLIRSDAKIYLQSGAELEAYQLLDPVFLEVIEEALTIFDIELCGTKVIIRADHLLSTPSEQMLLLKTIDKIISLKPKLIKAKYPVAITKPRMVLDDQALRTRFAVKGLIILALAASVYVSLSINF